MKDEERQALTTVLDREIEVPLTSDVDGALGEVVVDGSAVLDSLAGTYRWEWEGVGGSQERSPYWRLSVPSEIGRTTQKTGQPSPERMGGTGWWAWRAIGRMVRMPESERD